MTTADLGAVARLLRKRRGLSLRAVAKAVGCTHVHLSKLENDKVNPSVDLVSSLGNLYGVDLWVLAWCLYGDHSGEGYAVKYAAQKLCDAYKEKLGVAD